MNSLVSWQRRLGLLDVVEVSLPEVDVEDLDEASLEQLVGGIKRRVNFRFLASLPLLQAK